jgi:hypothetical protein
LSRFHEAFGQSNHAAELEHQWSLKSSPFAVDIQVLLAGQDQRPVIWIFDANDPGDGASRSVIEHEEGIIRVISHLRAHQAFRCCAHARLALWRAVHRENKHYRRHGASITVERARSFHRAAPARKTRFLAVSFDPMRRLRV